MTLLLAVSCSGELARVRPPQPRVEWASIINLQKQKMLQSCSCTQREEQFQPLTSQWIELRRLPCGPDQITLLLFLSWNLLGIFPYFAGVQWDNKLQRWSIACMKHSHFSEVLCNILFWRVLHISGLDFGDYF